VRADGLENEDCGMLNRGQPANAGRRQRGMSMVELMVGVTVGLIVVAAAGLMAATQLGDNRRLLLETQLMQDLRSSVDIITRELRRAGYWSQPELGVWAIGVSPAPNNFAALSTPSVSEVNYSYRRGSGQEGPYGFRLETSTGALRSLLAAAGWQDLTDIRTLNVTGLTITPVPAAAIILPCPKLCTDTTTDCWPRLQVREFDVTVSGNAVSDTAVQRTLRTRVRLRNDLVQFSDPLAPTQICPV
jgi:prepilin-type N-terminal cleavage/methylation domain-containing protein